VKYFFAVAVIMVVALSACSNRPADIPAALPSPVSTIEPQGQPVAAATQPEVAVQQEAPTTNPAFEGDRPLAARVNGQPIYLDTYQKQVEQLQQALINQGTDTSTPQGQEVLAQIQQQVLNTLIDQAIIEQQAAAIGITISEETLQEKVQESINQGGGQGQFEAWLNDNNLTVEDFKETLRSQLTANQMFEHITQDILETAEQVQIRQILVADEATAMTVIEQLKSGEDFAALAETHSIDESSRANGGYIDWFPRGLALVPSEVEALAFTLQPGEVTGPIQSALGFHIIQLEQREPDRALGDKQPALKQQFFLNWLAEQRSLTTIEKYTGM
jgi:parvulin-like peptidyl-prolyl isomerase